MMGCGIITGCGCGAYAWGGAYAGWPTGWPAETAGAPGAEAEGIGW